MRPNQTYKLLHSKGNHKQNGKRQSTDGEKILANDVTDKDLIPKYINSSCSSISKKQKPNRKMGRRPK